MTEVGSRWVHDDIMADFVFFFFFEESIDRRTVHLSLDTHVGDQAERSCAGTHAGSCVDKLWMHPKLCAKSADTHTLLPPPLISSVVVKQFFWLPLVSAQSFLFICLC